MHLHTRTRTPVIHERKNEFLQHLGHNKRPYIAQVYGMRRDKTMDSGLEKINMHIYSLAIGTTARAKCVIRLHNLAALNEGAAVAASWSQRGPSYSRWREKSLALRRCARSETKSRLISTTRCTCCSIEQSIIFLS
jgi:hypothetical protein